MIFIEPMPTSGKSDILKAISVCQNSAGNWKWKAHVRVSIFALPYLLGTNVVMGSLWNLVLLSNWKPRKGSEEDSRLCKRHFVGTGVAWLGSSLHAWDKDYNHVIVLCLPSCIPVKFILWLFMTCHCHLHFLVLYLYWQSRAGVNGIHKVMCYLYCWDKEGIDILQNCFLADAELLGQDQYALPENCSILCSTTDCDEHLTSAYSDNMILGSDSFNRRVYRCKMCTYSNLRLFNFKRHVRMHFGVKFVCDVCGVMISDRYKLSLHKKAKHE